MINITRKLSHLYWLRRGERSIEYEPKFSGEQTPWYWRVAQPVLLPNRECCVEHEHLPYLLGNFRGEPLTSMLVIET